jgi:hypothetical protein
VGEIPVHGFRQQLAVVCGQFVGHYASREPEPAEIALT